MHCVIKFIECIFYDFNGEQTLGLFSRHRTNDIYSVKLCAYTNRGVATIYARTQVRAYKIEKLVNLFLYIYVFIKIYIAFWDEKRFLHMQEFFLVLCYMPQYKDLTFFPLEVIFFLFLRGPQKNLT